MMMPGRACVCHGSDFLEFIFAGSCAGCPSMPGFLPVPWLTAAEIFLYSSIECSGLSTSSRASCCSMAYTLAPALVVWCHFYPDSRKTQRAFAIELWQE